MKALAGILVAVAFVTLSNQGMAQTMQVNPYKIIVNAIGNDQDIDCAFPGVIPSGYHIDAIGLDLSFNGTYVASAYFLDYCWIDNMFFAQFKRIPILQNPYVISLAGTGDVTALLTGWYILADNNGNTILRNVSLTATVQIEKPGAKKK